MKTTFVEELPIQALVTGILEMPEHPTARPEDLKRRKGDAKVGQDH